MQFREVVLPDGRTVWELVPTPVMIRAAWLRRRYGVHEAFRYIDAAYTRRIVAIATRKYRSRKGR